MKTKTSLNALKTRQQAARGSGDHAVVGTTLQIRREQLAEACDLRTDQRARAERLHKLMLCCVAAVAALYQTAQAAPTTGGGSDLRGVTQNWDKVLPTELGAGCPNWSTRFTCVMNNAAVRDNETGLVWTHPLPSLTDWYSAKWACLRLAVGNRHGWRLPSMTELASLIDMSNTSGLKLPANMPFIYTESPLGYWTSNTISRAEWPTGGYSYTVRFDSLAGVGVLAQSVDAGAWCVRGGGSLGGEY